MRKTLTEKQTITLLSENDAYHKRTFKILETLGSGSSCIAYRAIDIGTKNQIPVIIKECYPRISAIRDCNSCLVWDSVEYELHAKDRFRAAFNVQLQIQTEIDTMNIVTHLIDGLFSGNNTLYTVSGIQHAKTYDERKDASLQEVYEIARAVSKAIGKYHAQGFLHLDVKPQNILILPETLDIVKLLDFDSVVNKIHSRKPGTPLSYTHEYAAPELMQGRRNKLCEATDIYAIGAVVFSRIFGHAPSARDGSIFSDWELNSNPLFAKLSNKAQRLTKELLRKTLSVSISGRYQTTAELTSALDILVDECDPTKRRLVSRYAPTQNHFIGRDEELDNIRSSFISGKRAVFLSGMGGIGKTELALNYAEKYKEHYDTIAFGSYSGSLSELLQMPEFISIEHDAEGKKSLTSIGELVDERTLLIIDNFDNDSDPDMKVVVSFECNLLFTSRNSYAENYTNESAFAHFKISELSPKEQALLFGEICGCELAEEELDTVSLILKEINGYTLLIPLIAKTYKNDDYTLEEIHQRIHDAGLKGASGVRVRHNDLSAPLFNILCETFAMASLQNDELYIIRSLALLGNIVVNRKVFNSWLGNQYNNTILSLADKSWVQIQGVGANATVTLHRVISDIARVILEPSFDNCIWAYKLCEDIVIELEMRGEHKKLEYWQIPEECGPNSYHEITNVDSISRRMKARFLLTVLENLDYSVYNNITTTIKLLSKIVFDVRFLDGNDSNDISIINDEKLTDFFLSVINQLISAQLYPDVSGDLRFEVHRMLSTMCLMKHISSWAQPASNEWHPRYSCDKRKGIINEVINNIKLAEIALIDIENLMDYEKDEHLLRLAAPLITFIFTNHYAFDMLYQKDDNIKTTVDALFNYIFEVLEKASSYANDLLTFSNPATNYCSKSAFPHRDEFERRLDEWFEDSTMWDNLIQYGYHDDGYNEDDYRNDRSYEAWLEEVFYLNDLESDEADEYLDFLISDKLSSKRTRVERLVREISSLGFGPYHWGFSSDWRQGCIKNKHKASKYMGFLEQLINKELSSDDDYDITPRMLSDYYGQLLLLACCKEENTGTIDQHIDNYYSHIKSLINDESDIVSGVSLNVVQRVCEALDELDFLDVAYRFIRKGIDMLEAEVQQMCKTDKRYYHLNCSIVLFSAYVDDISAINHYTNVCIDVLEEELRNGCESDDQLYETLSSLIGHTARINDTRKTEYYKRRRQELLGVEVEIE